MRRYFYAIIVIVMSLCFGNSMAQTHYTSRVSLGVKGGLELSRIFFNPSVKQSFATGATAGITFRYIEESHFGLIAELNFAQRGWKENFEDAPYNYRHTINYLEIPLLAHIYFGSRGHFFFNAGPQIGFKIGNSVSANFNPAEAGSLPSFPQDKLNTEEMTMDINQKIDFGISAGLGGEFFIKPHQSLYAECRFYYGLGNVLKSGRGEPFSSSNSMALSVTLGYWFRIK